MEVIKTAIDGVVIIEPKDFVSPFSIDMDLYPEFE